MADRLNFSNLKFAIALLFCQGLCWILYHMDDESLLPTQNATVFLPLTAKIFVKSSYEETNKYWTDRIREYCGDHKNDINLYTANEFKQELVSNYTWMISNPHNLFYCGIPKCSSTTWKTYLMEDLNISWSEDTHE